VSFKSIYAKVTNRIESIAIAIPIQFFLEICSLNKTNPTIVDNITIATLFTVNIEELSNPSNCKAFSQK